MNLKNVLMLIHSDIFRYTGKTSFLNKVKVYFLTPGLQYSVFFRLCRYYSEGYRKPLFPLFYLFYKHYEYKYGISIGYKTKIGSGLCFGHYGNIFVNSRTVIGNNFNICQGVTIGKSHRGEHKGCPIIGDNVHISPGAKIIGNIKIGNNVIIGANSVVTKDVPDNAVVVGIPGTIISYKGSEGYVNNINYEICNN